MAPGIMPLSCCRAVPKSDGAKKPASETMPDQRWKLQVFYLCFYGFMTQIRPGESFITPYLLGTDKNFTKAEVTNMITPVLSYSYMAVLVPIFLLTDYLRYKPVLVLQSLSHISIWLLLVLGTSVLAMQLMEFFYGITMAARIAYSSYIFSLVAPSRYQRMASYSRSAVLLGVFTSSVLGQLCVSLGSVRFLTLNYVSLGFVSFGLILTLFLERPRRSLFFNRPRGAGDATVPTELERISGGHGGGGTRGWRDMVLCRMPRRSLFFNRPRGAGDATVSTELERMAGGHGGGGTRGWRDMVLCRMPRRSLFFNRPRGAGDATVSTELERMAGGHGGGGTRGWRDMVLCRMPRRSLFFNRPRGAGDATVSTELERMAGGHGGGGTRGWRDMVLCRMLRELGALARQPQLRLWSLWWVFNSAGYYLVLYYAHILWNEISPTTDNRRVYNGGVDAASTLLGAIASFAAGYVKIRWTLWSELVIGVVTAFQAGLLLLMNSTTNIWMCYVAYILFRGSHQFLVPIAIFQIATSLSKELCALVFGVNTFFATVLKTIITIIVADKGGLGLSVHPQFYVYFGYFALLAVVYLLAAIGVGVQHSHRRQPVELALAKEPCQAPVEIPAQEKSPEAGTMRA